VYLDVILQCLYTMSLFVIIFDWLIMSTTRCYSSFNMGPIYKPKINISANTGDWIWFRKEEVVKACLILNLNQMLNSLRSLRIKLKPLFCLTIILSILFLIISVAVLFLRLHCFKKFSFLLKIKHRMNVIWIPIIYLIFSKNSKNLDKYWNFRWTI
jgi:hypothetical protein